MTAVEQGRPTAPPRQRRAGELIVDLVIVVGSAIYVWKAQAYPPAGREIPTVVGTIAIIVGALQVIGWFVRPLWTLTHGDAPADAGPVANEPATAGAATSAPAPAEPVPVAVSNRSQTRDTVLVMAWAAGFLAAILVLGYRYAVPGFFLAYFGVRKQWKLAIGSAVVMWALTQFVFIDLLGINLPTSQFFVF